MAQVRQDLEPTLDFVPAGQTLQGNIPESENMPPGQRGVQLEAPAMDENPAAHFTHKLEPATE
jgi:hypothetical protein